MRRITSDLSVLAAIAVHQSIRRYELKDMFGREISRDLIGRPADHDLIDIDQPTRTASKPHPYLCHYG